MRSGDIGKIFFQRAHIGVDAHAVIVKNDQHIGIGHAGMVHCFKSQAGCHGAIADNGNSFTCSRLYIWRPWPYPVQQKWKWKNAPHQKYRIHFRFFWENR